MQNPTGDQRDSDGQNTDHTGACVVGGSTCEYDSAVLRNKDGVICNIRTLDTRHDDATRFVSYQDALPADIQDVIMRRLAVADPMTALCMASASALQRSLALSSAANTKSLAPTLVSATSVPTVIDYVRASIALGAHGSPKMAIIAQMQGLAKAYARLIFSSGRARDILAPLVMDTSFSSYILGACSADPCKNATVESARDWYLWATGVQPLDEQSSLAQEWKRAIRGTGRPGPSMQMTIGRVALLSGVEVGHGPSPVDLGAAPFRSIGNFMVVGGLDDTQLAQLINHADNGRTVMPEDVVRWRAAKPAGSDPEMRALLGSPRVAAVVKEYLSSGVADHFDTRIRSIETMTPLALPRFTDVFKTRVVFAPTHVDTLVLVSIRSPDIERLLFGHVLPHDPPVDRRWIAAV